jgi:hypothetical protein
VLAATSPSPDEGFWRVGKAPDPLKLPDPHDYSVEPDAPGSRFDSPLGDYAVIYFGTNLETCFMETLAALRPAPNLAAIVEEDWRRRHFMELGSVPADWRQRRRAVRARPESSLPFVDVEHTDTIQVLRKELAGALRLFGYTDLDTSMLRGPNRELTRAVSRWAFLAQDASGEPMYAGVRYCSRFGSEFECWALFEGAGIEVLEDLPIRKTMPALQRVAQRYDLIIH